MTKKGSKKKPSAASAVKVNGEDMTLEESLDRARTALEVSYQRMLSLHKSWRSQLQRVSVVVLIIILKQSAIPTTNCFREIQSWNEQITAIADGVDNDSKKGWGFFSRNKRVTGDNLELDLISEWDAARLCLNDSVMEVLSILLSMSLIWLMHRKTAVDDFQSLPFRLSLSLVPLIIASYYNNPLVGCLRDLKTNSNIESAGGETLSRTFPVILIFMAVSLASLFMMQYERKQQMEHIQKVEKLREDLLGTKKKQ